ncbi:hypothetical protein K7X08_005498 [Anisodus acutangulus]|uniref:Uncharacterized protein n=1 Tax=Anisodus acutangulus TaxID=402998 RepID=A0A9Q1R885_9SOLA|nr:hypothetical protein K7X08_005498 [Anisodus acutangulus]
MIKFQEYLEDKKEEVQQLEDFISSEIAIVLEPCISIAHSEEKLDLKQMANIIQKRIFSLILIVDDWKDWNKWINQQGGIGIQQDKSWQSWWKDEQAHLRHAGLFSRLIEILLSLRFFLYQYGLVYHLDISGNRKVLSSMCSHGLSLLLFSSWSRLGK